MRIYLIFDLINDIDKYNPWDWYQIGIKLGTEHIIYKKLANFIYKEHIHVNRLESVISGMTMCILQNKTRCKGGTEF